MDDNAIEDQCHLEAPEFEGKPYWFRLLSNGEELKIEDTCKRVMPIDVGNINPLIGALIEMRTALSIQVMGEENDTAVRKTEGQDFTETNTRQDTFPF